MKIYTKIDQMIGKTPLFEVANIEKELSLNDIADMRHDFSQNEETEKNVTLIPYDEVLSDDWVYWVSGGSVWHKTYNCGYIKSGSEVFYGTKESAAENGKTSVCSACEK